jgi:hypothetical protein
MQEDETPFCIGGAMQVTVLGADEQRCKDLGKQARHAVRQLGRHDRVSVVCDHAETALKHVHGKLGLMFDGQLVAEGFVPTADEIARMLQMRA